MSEPFPDIMQDLGQLSHLTASYLGRATAAAILLALGILGNDPMAIVVAALFVPFLSQVLAISFGILSESQRRCSLRSFRYGSVRPSCWDFLQPGLSRSVCSPSSLIS